MPPNHKDSIEAAQRGPVSLPGWSPLVRPPGQEEPIKNEPQQEEVVDEITAWWQKALGKKAVLGLASNRPPPGPRAPAPKLLWTKPENRYGQQERTVVEATPGATEEKGADNPGTQERGRRWMDRSLAALRQLKHWSAEMVSGTVLFLAVALLRVAVAVFVTVRAALGLLTVAFKAVRRWPCSFRSFSLRANPLPGENNQ